MFNNLIFVNYAIGMGGEFFIIELNKAINNTNHTLMFNESLNRYSYNDSLSDKLFNSIKPHHIINPVVQNYKNYNQYFINFFCYSNETIFDQLIKLKNNQHRDYLYTFENYIEDEYADQRIQNTIEYYKNYSNIKMLENQFIFEPSHFENNNYYNLNITNFFSGSRKINLFCNQYLHQYFSLLRVLKRHHFSQQDIFLHVVEKCYNKEDKSIALNLLFNYYKQFKYESKTFNEDLNINIGNVYFDNKIIDVNIDYKIN